MSAHQGQTEMVALLVEFGADVNLANSEGVTALMMAALEGHCDIVRLLVQAGADITMKDCRKEGALVGAAKSGHLNVVAYLLSCDWPPPQDVLTEQATQALVTASGHGHLNVSYLNILYEHGKIDYLIFFLYKQMNVPLTSDFL